MQNFYRRWHAWITSVRHKQDKHIEWMDDTLAKFHALGEERDAYARKLIALGFTPQEVFRDYRRSRSN